MRSHRPWVLLLALMLGACEAPKRLYDGAELDPRQVSWFNLALQGNIMQGGYKIDGKFVGAHFVTSVEMRPGRHRVDYDIHVRSPDDLEVARRKVQALDHTQKWLTMNVHWVDFRYVMEFDSLPGWGYTAQMDHNPYDTQAHPSHCLLGEPAQFTADKREPLLVRSNSAEQLLCTAPALVTQGVSSELFENPNYKPPQKKDKDAKDKK